jgi:hypothetical protein
LYCIFNLLNIERALEEAATSDVIICRPGHETPAHSALQGEKGVARIKVIGEKE